MKLRKQRKTCISPDREEWGKRILQVECDGELIGRNICRCNQIVTIGGISTKLRIVPELPGEINILSIQWLTIGPFQARLELKYPGLQIWTDIAIARCRQYSHNIGINF